MRHGIGVSPGVTVGSAYCIQEIFVNPDNRRLAAHQVRAELTRFENASSEASAELGALQKKVSQQVGPDEGAIFATQQSILSDAGFVSKIRGWIADDQMTAQTALQELLREYTAMFAKMTDPYLRERLADLRDVIVRLSSHLSDVLKPEEPDLPGPLVVVADELLPSQVVALGKRAISAVVTQTGGQTSHAAILARSLGIPAVTGVPNILRQVNNGDAIVVDGREGVVIVNPEPEVDSAYRKLQREFFLLKDQLAANRDLPSVSADGESVDLLANINSVKDLKAAAAMGAAGVGLYRTEYLYLTHTSVPGEEEQYEAYLAVARACPNQSVTIRTLDLGGDKTVPYLGHRREANPFMGWRSIRLSFEHPEFFGTQLRAVLRVAAEVGPDSGLRLLFPMIATVDEMRRVRKHVTKARKQLNDRGLNVPSVPLGLMLEVPAAAITIEALLVESDFVSIGSNDLVQYLMAADRDNPKVSHLCQPQSPAVLQVLTQVIRACNNAKKPVTLCGEMAGSPSTFALLFGMGLRSFSMSPAFIPTVKELVRKLTREKS